MPVPSSETLPSPAETTHTDWQGMPYYPYSQYLKQHFGKKVYKLTLDGEFTCPNIDGTKGRGGCTFCDETGSSSRAQDKGASIREQLLTNLERQRARFKAEAFIAYFQSHTNTYASVHKLQKLYDEAFDTHPDIIGLAVSTRSDCVDREKLLLIKSYEAPGRTISVEYGMQTIHDRTLETINRCETHADFMAAYTLTRELELDHCIHIILGLPGETHADMMATADRMAELRVNGVKIHLLVAMDKTQIAKQYRQGLWEAMSLETYVQTICDFIERLHPSCVIHRVAGNGHHQHVLAPRWMADKKQVMSLIEQEFAHRGTHQGSHCRFL